MSAELPIKHHLEAHGQQAMQHGGVLGTVEVNALGVDFVIIPSLLIVGLIIRS